MNGETRSRTKRTSLPHVEHIFTQKDDLSSIRNLFVPLSTHPSTFGERKCSVDPTEAEVSTPEKLRATVPYTASVQDLIRTRIFDKHSFSIKIATRLDHISRCQGIFGRIVGPTEYLS